MVNKTSIRLKSAAVGAMTEKERARNIIGGPEFFLNFLNIHNDS